MSGPGRKEIYAQYQALLKEWHEKKKNMSKIGQMVLSLKTNLPKLTFLPTDQALKVDNATLKQDLIIARDVLEIGALHSLTVKDAVGFERFLALLKCYYFDYTKDELPESVLKYQLLGLNLLRLLAQNRVAEFHTELELLPAKELQSNIYISHPVQLEQCLMEGRYNQVVLSRNQMPSEFYAFFMDELIKTIRTEIASCIETSYDSISLTEAARLLFLSNPKEVQQFAAGHGKMNQDGSTSADGGGPRTVQWLFQGNQLVFVTPGKEIDRKLVKMDTKALATQVIDYARELEMIV